MMIMLNATWLDTFVTLAETGHFTRTAQRLGMTQPGVSQHLRKLERQVGEALISQDGKSFTLTPAGEAVRDLGLARRSEEQHLRATITADDAGVGDVRIACSGSFAQLLYPQLIKAMHDAPQLMIQLEAAPQASVLSGVLAGAFDLGVVGQYPNHPRLESRMIGREELCLVLPAKARAAPVTFEDLETYGFVAHPDGFSYADELLSPNFPDTFTGGDRLHIRTFVNQIGQILTPVADGIGYTMLPRSAINAFPHRDQLTVATLPHCRHHDLWLIVRKGLNLSARVRRVAKIAETVAETLG